MKDFFFLKIVFCFLLFLPHCASASVFSLAVLADRIEKNGELVSSCLHEENVIHTDSIDASISFRKDFFLKTDIEMEKWNVKGKFAGRYKVAAGNYSCTGIFSRMKYASFTLPDAVKKPSVISTFTNISESASSDLTVFFSFKPVEKFDINIVCQNFSLLFDSERKSKIPFFINLFFNDKSLKTDFSFNIAGGFSLLAPKESKTWFSDVPFFVEKNYCFFADEISLKTDYFQIFSSLVCEQSPFADVKFYTKNQFSFQKGLFGLNCGFAFVQKDFITLKNTFCSEKKQIYLSPQYDFNLKKYFGFTAKVGLLSSLTEEDESVTNVNKVSVETKGYHIETKWDFQNENYITDGEFNQEKTDFSFNMALKYFFLTSDFFKNAKLNAEFDFKPFAEKESRKLLLGGKVKWNLPENVGCTFSFERNTDFAKDVNTYEISFYLDAALKFNIMKDNFYFSFDYSLKDDDSYRKLQFSIKNLIKF